MKVEILSKTRLRDRTGAIVTRYGCYLAADNAVEKEKASNVQITVVGEQLSEKDVGDTVVID